MAKLAFVFPGQGSQSVGMLNQAAAKHPLVMETLTEASDVLGYDLWKLVSEGPDDQLNQTEFTQPALLAASIALLRMARVCGCPEPTVVAGHSLGEYSALVASSVLTFADAIKLVQSRGQFMQTAVPLGVGGMAAVLGLEDQAVVEICKEASGPTGVVQAVNFNAPGQVVIAGHNAALDLAITALKAAGAKRAMALSVSAPFHSELMKPAAEKMQEALENVQFSAPAIDVIQNVDARFHLEPADIRQNLVTQMYSAVMWTDSVKTMVDAGVQTVVECGPGKVLNGLNRRIDKSLVSLSISDVDSLDKTLEELAS